MWSQSSHSDSESQPVRRWFQDTYAKEYLTHPHQPAFLHSTMSFNSPAKASTRSLSRNSQESPRRRLHSLSPRYLSPIVSHSGGPFEEEFVMGCSVCGTRAIEEAAWTYHGSPPRIRPSHRPELASVDGENSGAYAKILSWKATSGKVVSESISTREVKLLEGKQPVQSSPFPSSTPPSGLFQTTLVKEVFPTPSVPLTPLNYVESGLIKDSVFHNSLAERYVKDEERVRVAVRRAEYANRVKGFTRVVEAVKLRGAGEDLEVEAAQLAANAPLDSEESRPGARMKDPKRGSESRSSAASEEGRTENLELARRKLEAIKQTVRQRREERKSKEAALSPSKPTDPEDSEEEETPPHPIMTPAEMPPSLEELPIEAEKPQESLEGLCSPQSPSPRLELPDISETRDLAFERRADTAEMQELRYPDSTESLVRAAAEVAKLSTSPAISSRKGTPDRQEDSAAYSPAPPVQGRRSDQRLPSEQNSQESVPHPLVGVETGKRLEVSSEDCKAKTDPQYAGPPVKGRKPAYAYADSLGLRTSQISLPNQISEEDTTERVTGERSSIKAGLSSSRLTAEATERHSAWEVRTGSKDVRVLPKQQERRKVAAAKAFQAPAFHRLQWESAVRIQRVYRRHVAARNNKACQTECPDCGHVQVSNTQELLHLLHDPSILSALRLLGGFVSYLQTHQSL